MGKSNSRNNNFLKIYFSLPFYVIKSSLRFSHCNFVNTLSYILFIAFKNNLFFFKKRNSRKKFLNKRFRIQDLDVLNRNSGL